MGGKKKPQKTEQIKTIENNSMITASNDEDYKQFICCLDEYSDACEKIEKKKEYQKHEKKMFNFLEKSITNKNMPERDELYKYLRIMFQTMLYTRWKVVIRKGGSSLFYDLLCKVCNINAKEKNNSPVTQLKLETEDILQNIKRDSQIYNNTKRKLIGGALTGLISVGAMPFGGFFASALSNLPATAVMELIEQKGKIDVGFTTMPKTLWARLGSLPGEYGTMNKSNPAITKITSGKKNNPKNKNTPGRSSTKQKINIDNTSEIQENNSNSKIKSSSAPTDKNSNS